jgi:hypothetical protein
MTFSFFKLTDQHVEPLRDPSGRTKRFMALGNSPTP